MNHSPYLPRKKAMSYERVALLLFAIPLSCIVLSSCTDRHSGLISHSGQKTFNAQQPFNSRARFFETFDNNSMGWIYYTPDGQVRPLPIWDSCLYCYSPWWIDYNHAPPGGGYLHILAGLHTHPTSIWTRQFGFPQNFTNATVTIRIRGDVDLQESQMLFLAQATNGITSANYVLAAQPFTITGDWSEQTITLIPDPNQWLCLGSRHDRSETYGCYDIKDVLNKLNLDFIFVLFPLTIEPVENIEDKHLLRAGNQYHVKQERLPSGLIMFDWIEIKFAQTKLPVESFYIMKSPKDTI